jgi:hypothetical protein
MPNEEWGDMTTVVGDVESATLHLLETVVKDCLKASHALHQYQDSVDFEHLRTSMSNE